MTDWEPIERMSTDESLQDLRAFAALQREARDYRTALLHGAYAICAENPPHGAKGHRLSRDCDQCLENAT